MLPLGFSERLDQSRAEGRALTRALPQAAKDEWQRQQIRASARSEKYGIGSLMLEFQAAFRESHELLIYEHAFVYAWVDSHPKLYEACKWICGHTAGVYFIYDEEEQLRYVGTSYAGDMGFRVWNKQREGYRRVLDVVLFGEQWCHFALAFEALVVSRLRPPENMNFKSLWIPPPAPFDRIWPQP